MYFKNNIVNPSMNEATFLMLLEILMNSTSRWQESLAKDGEKGTSPGCHLSWLHDWLFLSDLNMVLNSFLSSRAFSVQSVKLTSELAHSKCRGNQVGHHRQVNIFSWTHPVKNWKSRIPPVHRALNVIPAKLSWTLWCFFFPSQGVLWHFRLIADTACSSQQGYTGTTYSRGFCDQKMRKAIWEALRLLHPLCNGEPTWAV